MVVLPGKNIGRINAVAVSRGSAVYICNTVNNFIFLLIFCLHFFCDSQERPSLDQPLGITIAGGKETGYGVFVSKVREFL